MSASQSWIIFENPGEIDPRLITTMGVNVKDDANGSAIGHFGTGLKYAIAIWLRLGCQIQIQSGLTTMDFCTSSTIIRGKEFQLINMLRMTPDEANWSSSELGFTTELGRDWKAWMAYRELWSNCKDENGREYTSEVVPPPTAGMTRIMISGETAITASQNKDWLLRPSLLCRLPGLEIHSGQSSFGFYQGLRVIELPKPTLFTYNVTSPLELTEDRTCPVYSYRWPLFRALIEHCDDWYVLRELITAPKSHWEHEIQWDGFFAEPSTDFVSAVEWARDTAAGTLSASAKSLCRGKLSIKPPTAVELSPVQSKMLDRAKQFLERLGYRIDFPIIVVESLGDKNLLGLAQTAEKQVLLPLAIFDRGTKYLASTLLEEHLHIVHGYADESREFQTFLLDRIVSMGEDKLGEPL